MTRPPISIRDELRETFKLAGPIVLNQVGNMSMATVDTLVAGQISTVALAGLGLAANFYWTLTTVFLSCLFALDTFFSQSVGAGDERGLARYLSQSFWACAVVGAVSAACILLSQYIYVSLAPPSAVRQAVSIYINTIIWCLPGQFIYFVLQRYWQARRRVLPFTVIVIMANILNLAACTALGLGRWGFPRLEVQGVALATVISRYAMLIAAVAFSLWQFRPDSLRLPRMDWATHRQLFRLGLPAAGHAALEVGAFGIATLIVARLGNVPLATNHACLIMASFTFMFPLGFSAAAAVRVGTFIGANQPDLARVAGWLCIGISAAVMCLFALGYVLFPRALLGAFSNDPEVIELGVRILALVAFFQIADGIQVSATGCLRGAGNTRAAMFANLIGHYPIGLVLGLVLCFRFRMGAVGLWTGLAVGLVVVATILLVRWTQMARELRHIKPVEAFEAAATTN
jgi:MATE family multidrug resistance protein